MGDASLFLLGDTFVSCDAPFTPGVSYGAGATILPATIELDAFCLVWHPPVSKPFGARIDRRCKIFRAQNTAVAETPADGTPTWNAMKAGSMPLILTAGSYAFGEPSATASFVPVGIGSTERPSRAPEFGPQQLTTTTPTSRYFAYIPPLPGYTPLESDVLVLEDGTQFTVTQPYYQQAGVVGSQLTIDRTVMAG